MPGTRGRPPKESSRTISLNIRLSKAEAELLKDCAEKLGKTRTDVIVDGVKLIAESLKK